jgi:hypothetical protein
MNLLLSVVMHMDSRMVEKQWSSFSFELGLTTPNRLNQLLKKRYAGPRMVWYGLNLKKKRPCDRHKRRYENNIKMDLREIW